MASLTELVASRMTPEVMQKLAGLAGISSPDAKRAIDALIPTHHQTLRRTDVEIEEVPGVRRFDDSAGDCRTSFTQRLAQSGLGYEPDAPTFHCGHGLAATEPCRRQRWETIEPDVRRLWEAKPPGTWAQRKDAVRFSWERVRGARSPRRTCRGRARRQCCRLVLSRDGRGGCSC
jgi:hypothetical protein